MAAKDHKNEKCRIIPRPAQSHRIGPKHNQRAQNALSLNSRIAHNGAQRISLERSRSPLQEREIDVDECTPASIVKELVHSPPGPPAKRYPVHYYDTDIPTHREAHEARQARVQRYKEMEMDAKEAEPVPKARLPRPALRVPILPPPIPAPAARAKAMAQPSSSRGEEPRYGGPSSDASGNPKTWPRSTHTSSGSASLTMLMTYHLEANHEQALHTQAEAREVLHQNSLSDGRLSWIITKEEPFAEKICEWTRKHMAGEPCRQGFHGVHPKNSIGKLDRLSKFIHILHGRVESLKFTPYEGLAEDARKDLLSVLYQYTSCRKNFMETFYILGERTMAKFITTDDNVDTFFWVTELGVAEVSEIDFVANTGMNRVVEELEKLGNENGEKICKFLNFHLDFARVSNQEVAHDRTMMETLVMLG